MKDEYVSIIWILNNFRKQFLFHYKLSSKMLLTSQFLNISLYFYYRTNVGNPACCKTNPIENESDVVVHLHHQCIYNITKTFACFILHD